MFTTNPDTVTSAERPFSVLERIKNVLRATKRQDRLSSFGVLAVEQELAKNINLAGVTIDFAKKKARKGTL